MLPLKGDVPPRAAVSIHSRSLQMQAAEAKLQLAEGNVFKHTHTPTTPHPRPRSGTARDGAGPRKAETILIFSQSRLLPTPRFIFLLIQNSFLK